MAASVAARATTATTATTAASPSPVPAERATGAGARAAVGAGRHRGLFTIPITPFDGDGALDLDSLRRVVAFCLESGADGIVSPVNVGEFTTLSAVERETVFRTIAQEIECAGRGGVGSS